MQTLTNGLNWNRAIMYSIATLVHFLSVSFFEKFENYQQYHSGVAVLTFASFTMNDPKIYPLCSEHTALIIGFIAISYLSTTFLTASWIHCTVGQFIGTLWVLYFYVYGLGHSVIVIAPALILCTISCGFNSYQVEKNEKSEFLEKIHNEIL